jgi:KipI family sensor histidine kinase inhibitor
MRTTIDLNADLGELEDGSLDAAVMPHLSSCNIACGAHAGNPDAMRRTVRLAKAHGVTIGAHPGYPDAEHFGRVSMNLSADELRSLVREQVLLLKQIAEEEGASLYHVKLHGALYNDLAFDYDRSLTVAQTVAGIDSALRFIVFSNSETARAVEDAGLVAIHEVFADRAYAADGRLRPRAEPGAVFQLADECLSQAARFVSGEAAMPADSICVHGDHPSAIAFVRRLRDFFKEQQIAVAPAGRPDFHCAALGAQSLLVQLPARIAKSTHRQIRSLQQALEQEAGIIEVVPCYAELKINVDPSVTSLEALQQKIESLEWSSLAVPEPRRIEVPVLYDGEDLKRVAAHNRISVDEVIRRHSEPIYLIYMLGFAPGFAYMGGLDAKLATPRLASPRISVPAGSVGIAGDQTGIYPVACPGGWNLIGRTPLQLFDPSAEKPFLFEPGDEVRFVPDGRARSPSAPPDGRARSPSAPPDLSGAGERTARRSVPTKRITIIDPGLYTTVQDRGRSGFLRYGLPPSGAMDRRAFDAANALLENDPDGAVLECSGTLPVLEFSQPTKGAVVYADRFCLFDAAAGERLSFEPIRVGYRAYIAFEGGIDVPRVLGSRSTYVSGKLGGFKGRTLRAGDVLPLGEVCGHEWRDLPVFTYRFNSTIRVMPGPEASWFDVGGLNTFLTEAFRVSSKSDRTGIRLEGTPLSFRSDAQMVSAGIGFGTLQVPPSGQPMIMMADHPTTGGYPRIGHVVEEDLSVLAQLKPGDAIRLVEAG